MNYGRMLFCSLLLIGLTACGSSSDDVNFGTDAGTEEGTGAGGGSGASTALSTSTDYFGVAGNLWKPRAEEGSSTAGLLVVLLAAGYTDMFDTCEVEKIDGTIAALDCNDRVPWSHFPYSCVANNGREHWRANFPCEEAAQVRVVCRNATEQVTFEAQGAGISAVCSRHG